MKTKLNNQLAKDLVYQFEKVFEGISKSEYRELGVIIDKRTSL